MKISGIYRIRNLKNHKIYIGSSYDIEKRWYVHKNKLINNKHHSCHLQNAWDKHGEKNFAFEIWEEVQNTDLLLIREQFWMDYFESYSGEKGYNIRPTAGSNLGHKATFITKQKMSKLMSGENHHSAILNWEQVNIIRQKYKSGKYTIKSLAKDYEVGYSSIFGIIKNKYWIDKEYIYEKAIKPIKSKPPKPLIGKEKIKDKIQEILDKYNLIEYTIKRLAKEYEVDRRTIRGILKDYCKDYKNHPKFHSEEYRQYQSNLAKERNESQEHREKISNGLLSYYKEHPEGREIRGKYHKNKVTSEDTKLKMSIANRGDNWHKSILTWELVNEIRDKYNNGDSSYKKLAKEYDVGVSTIQDVIKNRTWKKLE